MALSQLTDLTLAGARDGLRARQFSARELAAAHNAAVERIKPLNAFITATPEKALEMAAASDARLAKGEAGALEGIPLAIKDLFCTRGVLTTAASHILDGFKPPYESTVTEKLWAAGAVMLGKTNLDEFAMGSSNTTSYYGPVENPWRRQSNDGRGDNRPLVPGGSSGGSAAAVAAHAARGTTRAIRPRRPCRCRITRRRSAAIFAASGSASPRNTGSMGWPTRSRICGSRASPGCATPAPSRSRFRCPRPNMRCRPIT